MKFPPNWYNLFVINVSICYGVAVGKKCVYGCLDQQRLNHDFPSDRYIYPWQVLIMLHDHHFIAPAHGIALEEAQQISLVLIELRLRINKYYNYTLEGVEWIVFQSE